jgi:hypothetical protein
MQNLNEQGIAKNFAGEIQTMRILTLNKENIEKKRKRIAPVPLTDSISNSVTSKLMVEKCSSVFKYSSVKISSG